MRLVLLGAPGAGKGTQAKKIVQRFKISHISTGNILRNEIKNDTELGRKAGNFVKEGKLVPDDLIIEIIKKELEGKQSDKGFLMDGFPRNLKQAKMFQDMLDLLGIKLDSVINIDVSKDEIIKRLTSRRICHSCNNICSINNLKDMGSAKCSECGGDLIKREDDEIEVITERLNVYEKETKPLIDYYREHNLLVNIDGTGMENQVTERVLKHL
ncbi:MAG: adenylate kinase [Actinobacteria bacterium]|nr:adenylate kinase [Actinomycetota bacterium]